MSTSDDSTNDKVSADTSFLECHKLLKSMEDSAPHAAINPDNPTPNGHSIKVDDEEEKSLPSDTSETIQSKPTNREELVNSNDPDPSLTVTASHIPDDVKKANAPPEDVTSNGNPAVNGFVSENQESDKPLIDTDAILNGEEKGEATCETNGEVCENGRGDNSTGQSKLADVSRTDTPNKEDASSSPVSAGQPDQDGDEEGSERSVNKPEPMAVDEETSSASETLNSEPEVVVSKPETEKSSPSEAVKSTLETAESEKSDQSGSAASGSAGRQSHPETQVHGTSVSSGQVKATTWSVPTALTVAPKPIAPRPADVPRPQPRPPVTTTTSIPQQQQPFVPASVVNKPFEPAKGTRGRKGAKAADYPPVPKVPKELGPTASFLCDLGMDLVKEGVYKDLISIQSRKQKADKLNESEVKQLEKLRENYETVADKNKEVKVNYTLKCDSCKFVTESKNVMWQHHEYPHVDDRENMYCSHCTFATRIPVVFNFHMESEHQMRGRIIPKPAFWQCNLCQFETNSKGVLTKHRWKCEKGFNYKVNLSPTSSHVNYCLAYNFYKTPKPLHPLPEAKTAPPPQKTMVRPPVNRMPAHAVRAQGYVPQLRAPQPRLPQPRAPRPRPVIRQRAPGPPVRMVLQQQPPMLVQRAVTPQYQYVPRPTIPSPLTVRQMLNTGVRQRMPSRPTQPDLGLVACEICKGYVKDKDALRVHFFFAHQIDLSASLLKRAQPPLFCDICFERFWTSQGLQKHKETFKHYAKAPAPSGSPALHICIICGIRVTHLLNHMSSIHNLSLKDFLIAKRCIVCGGSFQNRPSLEIHLASSHGILVKTAPSPNAVAPASHHPTVVRPLTAPVSRIMPVAALKNSNACLCLICNISFLNNDLLTRHCQHCHASCVGCGMIFADVAARNRHQCSGKNTNLNQILPCLVCKSRVHSRNMRTHVMKNHVNKCYVLLKRKREWDDMARDIVPAKHQRTTTDSDVVVLGDSPVKKETMETVTKTAETVNTSERDNCTKSDCDTKKVQQSDSEGVPALDNSKSDIKTEDSAKSDNTENSVQSDIKTEDSAKSDNLTEDSAKSDIKTEDSAKSDNTTEDSAKSDIKTEDSAKADIKTENSAQSDIKTEDSVKSDNTGNSATPDNTTEDGAKSDIKTEDINIEDKSDDNNTEDRTKSHDNNADVPKTVAEDFSAKSEKMESDESSGPKLSQDSEAGASMDCEES